MKQVITSNDAPKSVGTYSQEIKSENMVFLSGQVPLDPKTMKLVEGDFAAQVRQVFLNLEHVAKVAVGSFTDMVKLTVYLTDLNQGAVVNDVMREFFEEPFPARVMLQVSALPVGAAVEIDGIMVL